MFGRERKKREQPLRDAGRDVSAVAKAANDLLKDWRREGAIKATVTIELPSFLAKLFGEDKIDIPVTIKLPKD